VISIRAASPIAWPSTSRETCTRHPDSTGGEDGRDAGYEVWCLRDFPTGQAAALHPDSGGHDHEHRVWRDG
jgi:hypothetical protein